MFSIQAKSLLYEVNLIGAESGGAEQQALILQAHEFPAFFFPPCQHSRLRRSDRANGMQRLSLQQRTQLRAKPGFFHL